MDIQSQRVWLDQTFQPARLHFDSQGKLTVLPYSKDPCDKDYGSARISPGLIDIHCHGYKLFNSAHAQDNEEGLDAWRNRLPHEGVTSFLTTTGTDKEEYLLDSFAFLSKEKKRKVGAQILGIYVEGPQISFEKRGAQDPYYIQKPDVDQFIRWQQAAQGEIIYIAIAPECDKDHALIRYCVSQGVQVALGHTNATYEECLQAEKDGALSFTHTYDGMRGLHHREPGVVGAAFTEENMYAELICDGVHVKFPACKVLSKQKDADHLILITDSVAIKGLEPGVYDLPSRWCEVGTDGVARLKDGTLAGSANQLNHCLRNAIETVHMDEVQAIQACTINPCRLLSIKNKGLIQTGYDADLTVLDDQYEPLATYIQGIPQWD